MHQVVRTNPVTGWNSIFPVGTFPKYIDGLEKEESDNLLKWFHDLIINGHDLQVRFRWRNPNDIGELSLAQVGLMMLTCFQRSGTTAAFSTRPQTTTMVLVTDLETERLVLVKDPTLTRVVHPEGKHSLRLQRLHSRPGMEPES